MRFLKFKLISTLAANAKINIMKKSLLLFSFISFSNFLFSQNENYNGQFGFDATGFIAQFLNFGSTSSGSSPYVLTYRKLGAKKNIRFGLGGSFNITEDRVTNAIEFRVGNERYRDFEKRWRALYGWDFKLGGFYNSDGNNNVTTNFKVGASPFFGLQFRINERLSVSTEAAYTFWLGQTVRGKEDDFQFSTSFNPPVSLFVQYDIFLKSKK